MRNSIVFCVILLSLSETVFCQNIVFPSSPSRSSCGSSYRCMRIPSCQTVRRPNSLRSCGRYRVCCPLEEEEFEIIRPQPVPSTRRPRPPNPRPRPTNPRPRPPEPQPVTPRPPNPTTDRLTQDGECGSPRGNTIFRGLVVGGSNVSQGTFPWMAAVMKRRRGSEELDCTGFMIDRRHALSAAHCFRPNNPERYSLHIGDVEWRKGTRYEIEKIDIPEGYRHRRFYDDIAVITLKRPITDPNFAPICLPTAEIRGRDLTLYGVTVAGWGSTRYGGDMSDRLLQLSSIPVISNEECHQRLSDLIKDFNLQFERGVVDQMVCAGFLQGGKDSCGGDSGGPLMINDAGRWYAVGIVSFGFECGLPGYPAGYTRVTSYLDYIRRHTT